MRPATPPLAGRLAPSRCATRRTRATASPCVPTVWLCRIMAKNETNLALQTKVNTEAAAKAKKTSSSSAADKPKRSAEEERGRARKIDPGKETVRRGGEGRRVRVHAKRCVTSCRPRGSAHALRADRRRRGRRGRQDQHAVPREAQARGGLGERQPEVSDGQR